MTGSRPQQVVFRNQAIGHARVIDPEIRAGQTETRPAGYRYARMRCSCGTVYLAQISGLYRGRSQACPGCSLREKSRRARRRGGKVYRSRSGWTVTVYVGHFKNRGEAERVAARARAVMLPETPPRTL